MRLFCPFYIFSYENNFPEYNSNGQKLKELEEEYKEILERLDTLENQGTTETFDKHTIIELSRDVIKEIAQKYENVQKGVSGIMGGALIETEARKKTALVLLEMGKLTIEEISVASELSIAEVEQLAKLQTV